MPFLVMRQTIIRFIYSDKRLFPQTRNDCSLSFSLSLSLSLSLSYYYFSSIEQPWHNLRCFCLICTAIVISRGWGVTWAKFWYGCENQYFDTYPTHIPGLWIKGPIHILDHLKCWPFYILPIDFLYPFFAGSQTTIARNSLNTKRTISLKDLWVKNMCIYRSQKNGAFYIPIKKKIVEKGG